jgi:hypothetical protein
MAGRPKKSVSIQPYVQTQEFGYYTAPRNLRVGALGFNATHNRNGSRVPRIAEENFRSYAAQGNLSSANQLAAAKAEMAMTRENVPPMVARRNAKGVKTRKVLRSYVAAGPYPNPENFNSLYNYKEYLRHYPTAVEKWEQIKAENEAAAVMAAADAGAEAALGSSRKRKSRKTRKSHRK